MPCFDYMVKNTHTIFTNIQLCYHLNSFHMNWGAAKRNTKWRVWRFAMATGVCDGYTTVLTEVERRSHFHTYAHSPPNLASTQQINFKNIKSVCEYIFNLLPQCTKHISSQTLRYRWQHNGSMPITHLSAQFRLLWKLQCQGYFRSASTHTHESGGQLWTGIKTPELCYRTFSFQYPCKLKSPPKNERYKKSCVNTYVAICISLASSSSQQIQKNMFTGTVHPKK